MNFDMSKLEELSFYGGRKEWYERLNLVNKTKRFCQLCTSRYEFWLAVAICAVIEPILCSKWPKGWILLAQVIVLAISSGLYVIQLIGVASREWDKIILIEAMTSLQSLAIPKNVADFTMLKLFIFFTAEGEYMLEFGCLLAGWILIFSYPGLAALRCFRLFRLLWFYEVEIFRSKTEYYFNPVFGELFVSRLFRVFKFAIKSLSALGNEMFRLTNETKGGLLLMGILFYSAYVLGASLWVQTNGDNPYCITLGQCTFSLMRLTFFDGTGFDFAYTLTSGHLILFYIVMMYMCLTSFGIINGLVGIFGTAFARASDLAFEDEEEHQQNIAINAELQQQQTEENGGGGPGGQGGGGAMSDENASMKSEGGESVQMYSDVEMQHQDENDEDGNAPPPPQTSQQRSFHISTAEELERKKQIAIMMAGGSKFTMKELMKPAAKKVRSRLTLRDLVKKSSPTSNTAKVGVYSEPQQSSGIQMGSMYSMSSKFNAGGSSAKIIAHLTGEQQQQQSELRPKKSHAAMGSMFGKQQQRGNQSSGGMNPISGSISQMYGAGGHGINTNAHQLLNMTVQMTAMQNKIDKQNESISTMFEHITHLTRQLQVLHPELAAIEPPVPKKKPHHISHLSSVIHGAKIIAPVDLSPQSSPSVSTENSPTKISPEKTGGFRFKNLLGGIGGSSNSSNVSSAGNSDPNLTKIPHSGLSSMQEVPNEDEGDMVHDFTPLDAMGGSTYNVLKK